MAKLPGSFNTSDVDGRMGDFSALPAGEYKAKIKDSARTPTKETLLLPKSAQAAAVHYYKLTIEITEGKFKGRVIWVNLNLEHAKENVVEIAEKELASICDAVGKTSIADTSELHNIEFMIKLGIKAATAAFPESNKVNGYSQIKGVLKPTLSSPKKEDAPAPEVKKVVKKVSF